MLFSHSVYNDLMVYSFTEGWHRHVILSLSEVRTIQFLLNHVSKPLFDVTLGQSRLTFQNYRQMKSTRSLTEFYQYTFVLKILISVCKSFIFMQNNVDVIRRRKRIPRKFSERINFVCCMSSHALFNFGLFCSDCCDLTKFLTK